MTTTSGYSCKLGERSSHYGPDQTQNARLLGYREDQKRTGSEAQAAAAAAADGSNETVRDDERRMEYGDRLEALMG
jgi:hypothetical protein